jgi:uncharacterized membrane protein
MIIAIALHVLASVIWVGGMFFAYMFLRPVAATLLEPPLRLPLWVQTFGRFFPWVWASIIVLLGTGYWMVFAFFGGMKGIGLHVHIMQGLGILMMLLFFHVFFAPYRRMRQALDANDLPEAGRRLNQIRFVVGTNLILGLIVMAVAASGRYWGM